MGAARHRRADAEVRFAAQAVQEHEQNCTEDHERGRALVLAKRPQGCDDGLRELQQNHVAVVRRHGWAGEIRRQPQPVRSARQLLFPIRDVRRQVIAIEQSLLPGREIHVLDAWLGQRTLGPCQKSVIERHDLAESHVRRPPVGNDVMQGEHQDMALVVFPDQAIAP